MAAGSTSGSLTRFNSPATIRRLALGVAGAVLVLAVWEAVVRIGWLPAADVSPPSRVVAALVGIVQFDWFWNDVGLTVRSALIGLGLACLIGIPLGIVFGSVASLGRAFRPALEFLRTVPGIALVPALVLSFGINATTEVFLITFGCTWPILVQTSYGVAAIDEVALQTARSYGLSRWAQVRKVMVPAVAPYVATSVRICSSIALIAAVTAGIVVGTRGIGAEISLRQGAGRIDEMYALILVTGILGIVAQALFGSVERHYLHWHQSQRSGRR